MWRILRRGLMPVALLGVGIASLVYGVAYHTVVVWEEHEEEITIGPPPGFFEGPGAPGGFDDPEGTGEPGDGFGGPEDGFGPPPPGPWGPPGGAGAFGAPPQKQTVTQVISVKKIDTEMTVLRDTTIGGVAMLETGELMRTYTGTPPSLCPT
ncbi:MAG: hypothetical protein JW818_03210 [Pirellulales bacterium]|nr:hypothetical protein [Pirellulales bacterium]